MWEAMDDFTLRVLIIAALVSLGLAIYMENSGEVVGEGDSGLNTEMIEGIAIIVTVLIVVLVSAFTNWNRDRQFRRLQRLVNKQSRFLAFR
jgi:hypothetical protein